MSDAPDQPIFPAEALSEDGVRLAGGVSYGRGSIAELPRLVAATGHRRAFVVTDPGIRAAGILNRTLRLLDEAGVETGFHDRVWPNPSTQDVDAGAAAARRFGPAVVIAVGGGSSLDSAKCVALLAGNPGARAADLVQMPEEPADGWPVIAVPTTAGTGSEANGFGVVEDPVTCRKVYLGHSSVRPVAAVLDPELTVGLPAHVTAATGIDALVHGIESLTSRGATELSDTMASWAISLVANWLPVAWQDGSNLEARGQLLVGAHLAGQALTISGLGLVHGIAHAVTAHTGTPHGVALAAVLEEVMAFNGTEAAAGYGQVARVLGVRPPGWLSPGQWAGHAVEAVGELLTELELKRPLSQLGVAEELLPRIAQDAMADPVTRNSPRLPTTTDVLAILHAAY